MTEHVSDLQLDEVLAGLRSPPEHLSGCVDCRGRLERAARDHRDSQASLGYRGTLASLETTLERRRRPWGLLLGAPALACALGMVFLLLPREPARDEADRLKGSSRIELRRASGARAESALPGERLVLVARGAGLRHLLVLGETAAGLEQLWPAEGDASGELPADAEVRLQPTFEVTPGDVALLAVFSAIPFDSTYARKLVSRLSEEAPSQRLDSGEVLFRERLRVDEGAAR